MPTGLKLLVLALALPLGGCAGKTASIAEVTASTQGKKLVVASLSVNDFNGSLQGWNKKNTDDILRTKMNEMLATAEARFGQKWTVVPAASCVDKPEYQKLAGPDRQVAVPQPGAQPMRLFGEDRKELVQTIVAGAKAQGIASACGADLVAIVYSEWTVATGSFVPTSKPLAKNVVSIYDGAGTELFHGRDDEMGDRTLGMGGMVVVDEETVDDWLLAFDRGLTNVLAGG